MTKGKKTILISHIALIIFLGCAAYFNSLDGKFIWDDDSLVKENTYIRNWSKIPNIFTESLGAGADHPGPYYRPLQIYTYLIDYSLWHLNTAGYHLTNISLHILVAICLYWLINILFGSRVLSFLTSALFITHPIHTEAVSYISGRTDMLAALFLLLCFICYIKQGSDKKTINYVFFSLTYILALLSKEHSFIMPLLILIYSWVFRKKILTKEFLTALGINLIYLVLITIVLGLGISGNVSTTNFFQRIPGFFAAITGYARLLLLPFGLHMEYGDKLFSFADYRALIGITLVSLALLSLIKSKNNKLLPFSILWFFTALLPTTNIYPALPFYMAEHWLYLPSIGYFIFLGYALSRLCEIKKIKTFAVLLTASILIFYLSLTIGQNNYWKEPISFYKRALHYTPDSPRLYHNLGKAYLENGNHQEAIKSFQKVIALDPKNSRLYNILGTAYHSMNKKEEAISSYEKAIEINPRYSDAYYNLGNVYITMNNIENAIGSYKKAVEFAPKKPHSVAYYNNLAGAYVSQNKINEAISMYEKALEIEPGNIMIYNNIKKLQDAIANNKNVTVEFTGP